MADTTTTKGLTMLSSMMQRFIETELIEVLTAFGLGQCPLYRCQHEANPAETRSVQIACGHAFCKDCILGHVINGHKSCPVDGCGYRLGHSHRSDEPCRAPCREPRATTPRMNVMPSNRLHRSDAAKRSASIKPIIVPRPRWRDRERTDETIAGRARPEHETPP